MLRKVTRSGAFAFLLVLAISGNSRWLSQGNQPLSTTTAAQTKRFTLNIEDARPLVTVADTLQVKYGIPISYEDVLWVNRDDLMPAGQFSHPMSRNLKNPNMLVPALARVDIDIDIDAKTLTPTSAPKTALEQLVNQHAGRRNPGEFRVLDLGNNAGFTIAPSRSKNAEGMVAAAVSPLDARISIPPQERTGRATLAAILSAVAAATGQNFVTFDTPFDSMRTVKQITVGANNEVARDVLLRTLRESFEFQAYWRLFYGPEEKSWSLTIGPVYKEILTDRSTTEIRPTWWVTP